MKSLLAFYRSSIGKKVVVAVSGLGLVGFVVVHLLGNLQIFLPEAYINAYAQKLHGLGPGLWVFRFGLLALVVLHVVNTIQLARMNRAARGSDPYAARATVQASKASLTMIISGLVLLSFIIYHILHFTVRVTDPVFASIPPVLDKHGHEAMNVYAMLMLGFQNVWVASFYLISMALLCLHLSHGFSSVFQTLGVRTKGSWPVLAIASQGLAWVLFLGNAAIVLSILLQLHPGTQVYPLR